MDQTPLPFVLMATELMVLSVSKKSECAVDNLAQTNGSALSKSLALRCVY